MGTVPDEDDILRSCCTAVLIVSIDVVRARG